MFHKLLIGLAIANLHFSGCFGTTTPCADAGGETDGTALAGDSADSECANPSSQGTATNSGGTEFEGINGTNSETGSVTFTGPTELVNVWLGQASQNIDFVSSVSAASCTTSPELPDGLRASVSASGCRINGTPTTLTAEAVYSITAALMNGNSMSADLRLAVITPNPPALADLANQSVAISTPLGDVDFVNSGVPATDCVSNPALPTGLTVTVASDTCRLSGTPTVASGATTYVITATAADGSTDNATVQIEVTNSSPPVLSNLSSQVFSQNNAITPLSFPNAGSAVVSCSVLPSLPTGLTVEVNSNTCRIVGTPTALISSTTFTVTGEAGDASTDTATVDIEVVSTSPPNIADLSPQTYAQNFAISPLSFTNTGFPATGCGVAPALPTGLSVEVNSNTCRIVGTPTAITGNATYTITATAADASTDTADVDIEIVAASPPNITDASGQAFAQGYAITPVVFTNTGSAAVGCSSAPSLPTGLTVEVNSNTCRIVGTPTALGSNTYTITATAADNSTDTADVDIDVNAPSPPNLSVLLPQTYTVNVAITPAVFINTGSAAVNCGSSPTLPTGLSVEVNSDTCRIVGTPTVVTGNATYTITATAADSSTDTSDIDIEVVALNPPVLGDATAEIFTQNSAISPVSFTNSGEPINNCSSVPTLPTGLTVAVNSNTCRITGTPTAASSNATYTITGDAANGTSDTATIDIMVQADPVYGCVWTGNDGATWNNASNWSSCGGGYPSGNDNVRIPSGTIDDPEITTNTTIGNFSAGVGGGIITLYAGVILSMGDTVASDIRFTGDGTVNMNGVTQYVQAELRLSGSADLSASRIEVENGGTLWADSSTSMSLPFGIVVESGGELRDQMIITGLQSTSIGIEFLAGSSIYGDESSNIWFVADLNYDTAPTVDTLQINDCTGFSNGSGRWTFRVRDSLASAKGIRVTGPNCASINPIDIFSAVGHSMADEDDPNDVVNWPTTCVWSGGSDTSWTNSGNWTSCDGSTPHAGSHVRIPITGNQPTISTNTEFQGFGSGTGGGTLTVSAATTVHTTDFWVYSNITIKGSTDSCSTCLMTSSNNSLYIGENVTLTLGKGIQLDYSINFPSSPGGTFVTTGGSVSSELPQVRGIYVTVGRVATLDIDGLKIENYTTSAGGIILQGTNNIQNFDNVEFGTVSQTFSIDHHFQIYNCEDTTPNDVNWTNITIPLVGNTSNFRFQGTCIWSVNVTGSGIGYGAAYEVDPQNAINW